MKLNVSFREFAPVKVDAVLKAFSYAIALVGYLSVARNVGALFSAIFLALALTAIYLDYKRTVHVPRWMVNTLSLLVISYSVYRYFTEDIVEPTVEAIMVLTAIKFLEDKKFRDYMQIYILSVFMLAGSALMSIDLIFLVFFIALFFLISTSIVILTFYTEMPDLQLRGKEMRKIVTRSLLIPLMSIPLSAAIFVTLPRTNFHFLGFLNRAGIGRAGFTDNVNLGEVSSIQLDTSVIFRAGMMPVNDDQLYWRGIVFDKFDGNSWKSEKREFVRDLRELQPKGKRVSQIIYLEPYDNKYLFTLDRPLYVNAAGVDLFNDFTIKYHRNINSTMRYDVVSLMSTSYPDSDANARRFLELPAGLSPGFAKLAKTLTAGKTGNEAVKSLFNHLHGGGFRYSLEKLPQSPKPLEEFLFNLRAGNCEYFASALAVLLRTINIPSRLVGGYRGGHYNYTARYYIVTQKNAHVWVEAFLPDRGWMRVDPTPPVQVTTTAAAGEIISRAGLLADTLNYYWNSFIINYNIDKQIAAIRTLHSIIKVPHIKPSFNKRNVRYAIYVTIVMAAAFIFVKRNQFRRQSIEYRVLAGFFGRLKSYGYVKGPAEGLEEFAGRIEDESIRTRAYDFIREYQGLFYRDRKFTRDDVARLKEYQARISTVLRAEPKEKAP
ncbi:MAG: DUF3488 domain-containing transglutaminase family protein [Nitrospirae bacterium]|nr:DUF3488 domain-containing transglutaminase family protein [Nitrospirota bacterium]